MASIDDIIKGLQILQFYAGKTSDVDFQHDECFAGPEPELVPYEVRAQLLDLGWYESQEHSCFYHFS